jgi:hypothetical protein
MTSSKPKKNFIRNIFIRLITIVFKWARYMEISV